MRIFVLTIYFSLIFYGAELVMPSHTDESSTTSLIAEPQLELPRRETVQNNSICSEYSSYKKCVSLISHEVSIISLNESAN